jgi:hypothetical protein
MAKLREGEDARERHALAVCHTLTAPPAVHPKDYELPHIKEELEIKDAASTLMSKLRRQGQSWQACAIELDRFIKEQPRPALEALRKTKAGRGHHALAKMQGR